MSLRDSAGAGPQELKIVIAGIGGQGVVFATRLLARTAIIMGLPVVASETHGMSQRGGSVVSHLKIDGTQAPLIQRGTADMLLALDASEGLRNLPFVRSGGAVFVNSEGGLPADMSTHLERLRIDLHSYPAGKIAMDLGTSTVANVALIGFAAAFFPLTLPMDAIERTLKDIASRQLEINLQALHAGFEAGRKTIRSSPSETDKADT
ncbi:MAG: indolepyruvate oxidoreductase subunit beta [Anaerolineales bacterium]